jgi:uncharacterized protein (TIGR02145 family)
MKQDLRAVPSAFASLTTTSWVGASSTDIGSWGYVNYTDKTGASGWATTAQSGNAAEGYLYQWSAAMNNATTERAQGVCPTGWHIPSILEFYFLWHNFGAPISNQTPGGNYTPPSMAGLHTTMGDITYVYRKSSPDTPNGSFDVRTYVGTWAWSSSVNPSNASQATTVDFENTALYNSNGNKSTGLKVRCLKD